MGNPRLALEDKCNKVYRWAETEHNFDGVQSDEDKRQLMEMFYMLGINKSITLLVIPRVISGNPSKW